METIKGLRIPVPPTHSPAPVCGPRGASGASAFVAARIPAPVRAPFPLPAPASFQPRRMKHPIHRQPGIQGCIKLLRPMRPGWVLISLSETNPPGLAAGSRWSARGKGADHRDNADKTSRTQKGCQSCCQPVFEPTRRVADFTCQRAVLASLQDARISSPRVRGSFPLLPRNDPRLPAPNPTELDWSAETNGKTSRKPAPACTNPSLMQPCPAFSL